MSIENQAARDLPRYPSNPEDCGVRYSDGRLFVRVKESPRKGQYTFNDGVYTFSSHDSKRTVVASVVTSVGMTDAVHKISRNRKRLTIK